MTTMSKLMKTVGKFKLWTILGVLVIAAGILIGAVFGFHADPTLSNVKTINVKLEAYDNEARTEAVRNICESELDKAGLKDTYTFKGEVSGLGNEVVYVFSENTDASKLETAQTAIQNSLDAAAEADGNVLKGAFFYVSLHEEKVETVLASGYLWRGALAAAVILVIEFVYIAVRYKLNMGATAAATSLLSVLLTLAIVALARIPVTASVIYVAAFAMLYSAVLCMLSFNRMRENFKTDEYKGMPADQAIASSVPAKVILLFAVVSAAALVLVGAVAVASVRWFALAALTALASGTYASLLFMPAMYLPLKKISDKKEAERARYDYKKGASKKEGKETAKTDAPSDAKAAD